MFHEKLSCSCVSSNGNIFYGKVSFSLENLSVEYLGNDLSKEISFRVGNGFFIQNDMNSKMAVGYSINIHSWALGETAGVSGDGQDGFKQSSVNTLGLDIGIFATWYCMYKSMNNKNADPINVYKKYLIDA